MKAAAGPTAKDAFTHSGSQSEQAAPTNARGKDPADHSMSTLARSYAPLPLIGHIYNPEPEADFPVVLVATDTVSEHTAAVLRDIRPACEGAGLVVLYAGDDPAQEIVALEAGADDCIRLEVDYRYLVARLRACMARLRRSNDLRPPSHSFVLDPLTHQAVVGERRFSLSPLE
ncbi:MAG TPA: hypothetical protein VJM51_03935, partial [Dehalococcoidia bacterium]|nr:hypothetical protein [Dehalococcoidia bacterium]